MLFRNLDADGDWTFGKGKSNYVERNAAAGLNIKTRLYSWFGDCFFAQTEGLDWVNRLGSKNQRDLLEADLRRIVLQSEDVTGIINFDTILVGRKFTANFSVTTVYGEIITNTITQGA